MTARRPRLPPRLHLPSGRTLEVTVEGTPRGLARRDGEPLFAEVFALGGAVKLAEAGRPVAFGDLALVDFHALRAVLGACGWLAEEPIEIACRNCGSPFEVEPCALLPLGPFKDGELGDAELDRVAAPGEAHPVAATADGAEVVVFAPRTAGEARPFFAALAAAELCFDAEVVRAMGIESLGATRDPAEIAEVLGGCSDASFADIGDAWLATHYSPRLFGLATCPACGARNDVDAPYERELEPSDPRRAASRAESPPTLDELDAEARGIFDEAAEHVPGEPVVLVVEGGTPACDDGGEPLLGSYVPPVRGDERGPSMPATVTVYHRTFVAMWEEDGPYDWRAELEETIAHELEHHVGFLVGDDPMDDEERSAIAAEAVRVHGKKELARLGAKGVVADVGGFLRRTWPLWVIAVGLAIASVYCGR